LWYKYRSGVNQITFTNAVRSPQDPPDAGFHRLAEQYSTTDRSRVFPFVVNEDLSVMGVRSVIFRGENGGLVDEVRFPSMENAKADRLISAYVAERQHK
jgi:hypothetical protein